jgi:hypothetical protein
MVSDRVGLIDVKPLQNAPSLPLLPLLRSLAAQVLDKRKICRAEWWRLHQTACLDNKFVDKLVDGTVSVADAKSAYFGTGTIVKGSGRYVQGHGVQVRVRWNGGTTKELLTEM